MAAVAVFLPLGEGMSYVLRPESVPFTVRPSSLKRGSSFNLSKVFLMKKLFAFLTLSVMSIGSAFAAVDAAVTTAMSDAKTDVGTIGAASLIVVIAIAVFRYLKRTA